MVGSGPDHLYPSDMSKPKFTRPFAFLAAALLAVASSGQPVRSDNIIQPASSQPAKPAAVVAITPFAHIEKRGTGPIPMILMPGLLCDWTVYDAFMTRNADKYTMYAITLPGFGGSKAPPLAKDIPSSTPVWLDNAQAAVLQLITEKKLDKPVFVGHSMGAFVAARLSANNGGKFRSLIAIDGYPAFPLSLDIVLSLEQRQTRVDDLFKKQFDSMTEEEWLKQMRGNISAWVTSPERATQIGEMAAKVTKATGARYMLELLASDCTAEFAASTTPFLFVGAIRDGTSAADAEKITANIHREFAPCKAAVAVALANTRHFVMDDAPEKLDQAIAAFIAGKPVDGALTLISPPAAVKAVPVEDSPARK